MSSGGFLIFPAVTVGGSGTGVTLQLAASGLNPATTINFNVTPSTGTGATQLLVSPLAEPPANLATGQHFTIIVYAANSSGAVDASYNGNVRVTLSNPAGNLIGTTTVPANAGRAAFQKPTVINPGVGYTLSVSSGTLGTATTT
jgi:hypothetical protein